MYQQMYVVIFQQNILTYFLIRNKIILKRHFGIFLMQCINHISPEKYSLGENIKKKLFLEK